MTKFSELRKSFEGAVSTGLMTAEEVNEKLAKAFAAGTAENDETVVETASAEPTDDTSALAKAIDAAAEGWMAKADSKDADADEGDDDGMDFDSGDDADDADEDADDDGGQDEPEPGDEDEDADNDAGDEPDNDEDDDMKKGFGLDPDAAAQILAKAVGAEVASQNEPLHVALQKALGRIAQLAERLESVGNLAYAIADAQKTSLAKGQTPAAPAQVLPPITVLDPDVTARLDRIEKAIKAPVGTFRGITDIASYEAIDAPGDQNDPSRTRISKAGAATVVAERLLEMQKAAKVAGKNDLANQIHEDIGRISIFPHQAGEYAAKYDFKV